MQVRISFEELTEFISKHYNKIIKFSCVSKHTVNISTTVEALLLTKTIGINLSIVEVVDNNIKLSYDSGWGTDLLIKGCLGFISKNMPAYNKFIQEGNENTLIVHLKEIKQLKDLSAKIRVNSISFGNDVIMLDFVPLV